MNNEDEDLKAYQERYLRILGITERGEHQEKTKSSRVRLYLSLAFLFLGLVLTILVVKMVTNKSATNSPKLANASVIQQQPKTLSQPNNQPVTPRSTTEGEKLANHVPANVGANLPQSTSPELVVETKTMSVETKPQTQPRPIKPGSFLVVLLSTTSKEEAMERVMELGYTENLYEVILSQTGYYAVVLQSGDYKQAQTVMESLVESGITKTKPYIMPAERVKTHVYP